MKRHPIERGGDILYVFVPTQSLSTLRKDTTVTKTRGSKLVFPHLKPTFGCPNIS